MTAPAALLLLVFHYLPTLGNVIAFQDYIAGKGEAGAREAGKLRLEGKEYLTGKFSVADAYLFTVMRWADRVKLDLAPWPAITAFMTRMRARPAVQAALKLEGLAA